MSPKNKLLYEVFSLMSIVHIPELLVHCLVLVELFWSLTLSNNPSVISMLTIGSLAEGDFYQPQIAIKNTYSTVQKFI